MPHNESTLDRVIRAVLGVVVLGLYGALPSPWRYATLLGLVLIGTAITGYCPLYRVIGCATRRQSSQA